MFVELTYFSADKKFLVNMDKVAYITKNHGAGGGTLIVYGYSTGDSKKLSYDVVKESYEEIRDVLSHKTS